DKGTGGRRRAEAPYNRRAAQAVKGRPRGRQAGARRLSVRRSRTPPREPPARAQSSLLPRAPRAAPPPRTRGGTRRSVRRTPATSAQRDEACVFELAVQMLDEL